MFTDYYAILNIEGPADIQIIKSAYREQAKVWHPDRNPGIDTTEKMQQIVEAYILLSDPEAKYLYDQEYLVYTNKIQPILTEEYVEDGMESNSSTYTSSNETLNRWMRNARAQSLELIQQVLKEFADHSKVAATAFAYGIVQSAVRLLILGVILTIAIKACK